MPVGQPKHGDRPWENPSPQTKILNITMDTYNVTCVVTLELAVFNSSTIDVKSIRQ